VDSFANLEQRHVGFFPEGSTVRHIIEIAYRRANRSSNSCN